MATIQQPQRTQTQTQPVRRPAAAPRRGGGIQGRRIRVAVRRVNPMSVLKFSLLFYFCLMLVVVIGLSILFTFLDALGVLASLEEFMTQIGFGGESGFEVNTAFIFRTLFLIGLISVILWSAVTVFVTFLYNLISDLVGGIEVTLQERR